MKALVYDGDCDSEVDAITCSLMLWSLFPAIV